MKKIILAVFLFSMLVFTNIATAGPWDGCHDDKCVSGTVYTWTETYNPSDIYLSVATGALHYTDFTLDITDNVVPFEVGVDSILSAILKIYLKDDSNHDSYEAASVTIDSTNLIDDYWWTFSLYGGSLSGTGLANLTADGKLYVVVTATSGDFIFDSAELTAEGCNNTSTSVPEPAAMLLLGFGLIGIAGLRKKLRK